MSTEERARKQRRVSHDVLAKKVREKAQEFTVAVERAREHGITVTVDTTLLPAVVITGIKIDKAI